MTPLRPGDLAPDFDALTHSGEHISLSQFRGRQATVVYFYPRDNTSICTAEACSFRDAYEDFVKAGAVVIGISHDSLKRHRAFAQKQRLPFHLVSDADGALRTLFRVPKTWGIFPGRVTYVIDKEGVIRHVLDAQFTSTRHIAEALAVVKQLANNQHESRADDR